MIEPKIKILSYNIHKGVSFFFRTSFLNKLKALIENVDADIVFLQEIKGRTKKDENCLKRNKIYNSQLEFLADQIWTHFSYGKNAVYTNGDHGNAILSKFPMYMIDNLDLSNYELEKRGLLHSKIEHPKMGEIHLLCSHLDLLERGREKQKNIIQSYIDRNLTDKKFILAGDFNDWRKIISFNILDKNVTEAFQFKKGSYASSFPSFYPILPLDRVYLHGLTPLVCDVLSHKELLLMSDHLPLVVDLN